MVATASDTVSDMDLLGPLLDPPGCCGDAVSAWDDIALRTTTLPTSRARRSRRSTSRPSFSARNKNACGCLSSSNRSSCTLLLPTPRPSRFLTRILRGRVWTEHYYPKGWLATSDSVDDDYKLLGTASVTKDLPMDGATVQTETETETASPDTIASHASVKDEPN